MPASGVLVGGGLKIGFPAPYKRRRPLPRTVLLRLRVAANLRCRVFPPLIGRPGAVRRLRPYTAAAGSSALVRCVIAAAAPLTAPPACPAAAPQLSGSSMGYR
ncbi:hypothetical protein C2845_PM09G09930 [Panicum miliaceum]|uniref:Uncharacterized protein n=1 Tax=Panicum miliaceum TaxID=4540 RepID=A0A3L6RY14_PANMI|nr:hypothetical protein C2845_PM09G09930 [Panicum miliaceum]